MENDQPREQSALERLLLAHLDEQRRARRWGIFFKSLGFIWLFLLIVLIASRDSGDFVGNKPHTGLIDIQGEIGGEEGVHADDVIDALNTAFNNKHAKAVVLRINSPGGSPVQAGQIYDEIRRLRAKHKDKPVYVVVEDICASGGYYIAAAADKIFVDKASLVGSIGVLIDGFGFVETLKKLGIERRLLTAGENKSFLDPFSPLNPQDVAHAQSLLNEIHQQFIQMVRQGRGDRLREQPGLYSGLIWNGTRSIELGLADGLGNLHYVAREVVKAEEIVDYTPRESLAERLARRLGTAIGRAMGTMVHHSVTLR